MTILKLETGETATEKPAVKINPTFEKLIPPLAAYEQEGLEKELLAWGRAYCPLITWDGVLLDGHHRYAICQKHGLPFKVEDRQFEDEKKAMAWMIRNQLKSRRNVDIPMRIRMELKLKELESDEALWRMKSGGYECKGSVKNPPVDLPDPQKLFENGEKKGDVRDIIGKRAGVSGSTVSRFEFIERHDPELAEDLSQGKCDDKGRKLTIDGCYNLIKNRDRKTNFKTLGFPEEEDYEVFYCDPYLRCHTSMSGWEEKTFITEVDHLPVADISFPMAALFLWSPVHMLEDSLDLLKTWGFSYSAMLIWKLNKPIDNHQSHENHVLVLMGTKGGCCPESYKPLSIIENNGQGSRHDQVRKIIEKMYPNKKKLELLAHEQQKGWDIYKGDGNQQ